MSAETKGERCPMHEWVAWVNRQTGAVTYRCEQCGAKRAEGVS